MKAYVLAKVTVRDDRAYGSYRALAQHAVFKHGGKYLARGGKAEAREGATGDHTRFVILEFPSMSDATKWYESREYGDALIFAKDAFERRLIFIEGVAP